MASLESRRQEKPTKSSKSETGSGGSRRKKLDEKEQVRSLNLAEPERSLDTAERTQKGRKLVRKSPTHGLPLPQPEPPKTTRASARKTASNPAEKSAEKSAEQRTKGARHGAEGDVNTEPVAAAATVAAAASATVRRARKGCTEADSRRDATGKPSPTIELSHPERVADLAYLVCFRGRKFGRSRFADLIMDRIASSEATERFMTNVPVELIALFLAREVRPVSDDRAPLNECFELPDGGSLEFIGDHMEAAETIARLLVIYDEPRLEHVVELLTEHDRSWLHTFAIEARDGRLSELGFLDLDDVDRLFAPWHARLLIRKLQAWAQGPTAPRQRVHRSKITPDAVLAYAHGLPEPERHAALDRLHFLALCQAVQDTRRAIRRMTPDVLNQSAAVALRVIAGGLQEAGGDMTLLAGPQVATVYRLGLATTGLVAGSLHEA